MKLPAIIPSDLLLFFSFLFVNAVHASFSPVDSYLLACGSSKPTLFNGRSFLPDSIHPSVLLKSHGRSIPLTSTSPPSPHFARVFTASSSYIFQIKQKGRHWLRLYFSPFPTSDHDLYSASFSVLTDDFVLLHNLSLGSNGGGSSLFFKEYAINITSPSLTLTFIPLTATGIAFVNAIEVVSIPDEVFPDQAMQLTPSPLTFTGLSKLAYETSFRLNMGGPLLTTQNDTLGRRWDTDRRYLRIASSAVSRYVSPESVKYTEGVTPEIAPNWVYSTAEAMGDANLAEVDFNMTWTFPVDPAFSYLVRAHFCDVVSESMNTLVFNLYLNSYIAIPSLDLSSITGSLDTPYFKDFLCNSSSGYLTVSVGPDTSSDTTTAIINGLEIIKLSNAGRSLAHGSPMEEALTLSSSPSHTKPKKPGVVILSTLVVFTILALISLFLCCIVIIRRLKSQNHPLKLSLSLHSHTKTSASQKSGAPPTSYNNSLVNIGRVFTFHEIMDATNRFDERRLLGMGGFGRVYEGIIKVEEEEENKIKVAVKRGNSRSEQGMAEFRTEINMLSKLRHRHLVSLIGYCDEEAEMVLVYEYMANGPLRSHLYGTDLPPLSWKQRLEICIGAARGLHYLHTGATVGVIHRDVKTTNILLDENLVAKVADFGLSKTGPSLEQTHVSTAVKGSFGYLDPEYFRRQQLTEKSDVYSFGVVMVEVVCARPALNPVLPREQVNIAEWAMGWQKRGLLEQIVDPKLVGRINNQASLKKYGETAEKCLGEHGVDRPSMGDVLWNLEYALLLEETACVGDGDGGSSTNHIQGLGMHQLVPLTPTTSSDFDYHPAAAAVVVGVGEEDGECEEVDSTSAVFSQLINPVGR